MHYYVNGHNYVLHVNIWECVYKCSVCAHAKYKCNVYMYVRKCKQAFHAHLMSVVGRYSACIESSPIETDIELYHPTLSPLSKYVRTKRKKTIMSAQVWIKL